MNQLVNFVLLALACSACERNERQMDRDRDDQGRTGDTPPPRAENPQPTVAPPSAASGRETVGAREQIALARSVRDADADFKAAKGQKIGGEAEFQETADGVHVVVELKDAPTGMKGVHIHEKGDCSNIEGMSMGKHFAPKGAKHGLPGSGEHHLGDLGNVTIDDQGKGRLEITVAGANLKPDDPMSLLGKAIAVHSSKDTGAEPDGASGKPIACAVIED